MWVPQLLVAVLLLAGALAVAPPDQAQVPVPEHRAMRVGDAAAYQMDLRGAWVYDGLQAQAPLPGPRFEVREPELITRSDGSRVHAFPVVTLTPATTLLPATRHEPTWQTVQVTQWLDGARVATQAQGTSSVAFGVEPRGSQDALWTYPTGSVNDCLLHPAATPCDLPAFHLLLGTTAVQDLGVEKVLGAQLHHLRADDGTTRVDWWFGKDIPFPLRVEAATGIGATQRTLELELIGFEAGSGTQEVLRSGFAPSPLVWAARQAWGPQDADASSFSLSDAYKAAWNDPDFPDLRQWLARHDGYVFMAEPSRGGQEWHVHLSDGREGFGFRARLVAPLLPMEGPRIELSRLEPSPLAPAAPRAADAPSTLPTVTSMWDRWDDHAQGDVRRAGANAWAFRILEGPAGLVVQLAAGRADEIRWGLGLDLPLVATGSTQEAAILVMDGEGQAMSYRQGAAGGEPAPAAAPPFVPTAMPDLHAWPWTAAQTSAGLAAIATAALVLPKAALALFTRFRPGELLEHPMRAMVMDVVRAEPGLHFRALCTRLGANPGRVRHHVRKLVEGAHLIQRATPGYTCYFPQDGTPRSLIQAGPLMRSDGARSLVGLLAQLPGANAKQLADLAGLSPATTTYHLKRLQQVGLVDAQRQGRCLRLHLTPDGQQALAAMG